MAAKTSKPLVLIWFAAQNTWVQQGSAPLLEKGATWVCPPGRVFTFLAKWAVLVTKCNHFDFQNRLF